MKGRIWLLVGAATGVAIGVGKLAYLAGAATSLSGTAQRIVGTGGLTLIHAAARHGAPRRAIEALVAVLALLVPGITALVLVCAARGTLRLRTVIAFFLAALGAAAFFYLPHGAASGVALLGLVIAGIAVVASGPLVAAPLAAVAALIGTLYLPLLLASHQRLPTVPVAALHQVLFATAGTPLWLRLVAFALGAVPFALAARLILR
ncbi:MAG: hypothetical protein ACYCSF_03810 [Acidimicrobiales bacterium]